MRIRHRGCAARARRGSTARRQGTGRGAARRSQPASPRSSAARRAHVWPALASRAAGRGAAPGAARREAAGRRRHPRSGDRGNAGARPRSSACSPSNRCCSGSIDAGWCTTWSQSRGTPRSARRGSPSSAPKLEYGTANARSTHGTHVASSVGEAPFSTREMRSEGSPRDTPDTAGAPRSTWPTACEYQWSTRSVGGRVGRASTPEDHAALHDGRRCHGRQTASVRWSGAQSSTPRFASSARILARSAESS